MVENIADLEGFRSLFAADGAGLVVDCLFRAGGGGFQVLCIHGFRREIMCCQIAVFRLAILADSFRRAGGRAAGAADGLGVAFVSLADAGVGAVAVGLPLAPVVVESIAGLEGFRPFSRQTEQDL